MGVPTMTNVRAIVSHYELRRRLSGGVSPYVLTPGNIPLGHMAFLSSLIAASPFSHLLAPLYPPFSLPFRLP